MREMFSLGMTRICCPEASSAPCISAMAVDIQSFSELRERFLKPRTAMEGRGLREAEAALLVEWSKTPMRVTATVMTNRRTAEAMESHIHLRPEGRGVVGAGAGIVSNPTGGDGRWTGSAAGIGSSTGKMNR